MQNFSHTIWMGDLEEYMDEPFVKKAFDIMATSVVSVKVIKNKITGQSMGYCFVEFINAEAAQNCMLKLNGKLIPNSNPVRRFKLNHASYGKEHLNVQEYSLFVGELSEDVDDLALYNTFRKFASCRSAKVVLDNGASRGYGFVRFTDEADQKRALIEMQNYLNLGRKPIRVSLATPKRAAAAGLGVGPGGLIAAGDLPTAAETAMSDTVAAAIAASVSGSSEAQADYYQAAYQAYQAYYQEQALSIDEISSAAPSSDYVNSNALSVTTPGTWVPPPPPPPSAAPSTYLEELVDPDDEIEDTFDILRQNSAVYQDFENTRWTFTNPELVYIVAACHSSEAVITL